MTSSNSGLEVITLNIWGLLLVSKRRRERVKLLGAALQGTTAVSAPLANACGHQWVC